MLDIPIQPYVILQKLITDTCIHESQIQADTADRETFLEGIYWVIHKMVSHQQCH